MQWNILTLYCYKKRDFRQNMKYNIRYRPLHVYVALIGKPWSLCWLQYIIVFSFLIQSLLCNLVAKNTSKTLTWAKMLLASLLPTSQPVIEKAGQMLKSCHFTSDIRHFRLVKRLFIPATHCGSSHMSCGDIWAGRRNHSVHQGAGILHTQKCGLHVMAREQRTHSLPITQTQLYPLGPSDLQLCQCLCIH